MGHRGELRPSPGASRVASAVAAVAARHASNRRAQLWLGIDSGRFGVNDPRVLGTGKAGGTQWWRYIPVSRPWPTQFIEAGWLLALSVLLIAATAGLVRHRAA